MIRPVAALWRAPSLAAIFVAAIGIALGLTVRLLLVEPAEMGSLCRAAPELWQCHLRNTIIVTMNLGLIGAASLLPALVSLWSRGRMAVLLVAVAMLFGGIGVVLFNATLAAGGLLLGLLRAVRLGDRTPEPQHLRSQGPKPR